MKNFEILKLDNSEYDYLVIATTYISPISTLDYVQNELTGQSGSLVFDLTLINGTSSNRYISAVIENGVINRRSFAIVKEIEPRIERRSLDFFVNHVDLVKDGTIPNALKSLLVAGECV